MVSVEVDTRLQPLLAETMAGFPNFKLVMGDVLKVDLAALLAEEFPGMPVAVCANLPYYITSPILMRLLEERLPIRSITVMVQKEAAQRLCAAPGTRQAGAISYAVAYYASPRQLFTVQPGSFYPAPRVTSAVIRLDLHDHPPVQPARGNEAGLFRLIRAAFSQRRKTAANAVAAGLNLPKAQVTAALQAAGLDPRLRPRTADPGRLFRPAGRPARLTTTLHTAGLCPPPCAPNSRPRLYRLAAPACTALPG